MESLIAACGIDCKTCPAFIATKKNDAEEKKKTATLWSTESMVFDPEDIHCQYNPASIEAGFLLILGVLRVVRTRGDPRSSLRHSSL